MGAGTGAGDRFRGQGNWVVAGLWVEVRFEEVFLISVEGNGRSEGDAVKRVDGAIRDRYAVGGQTAFANEIPPSVLGASLKTILGE